MLVVELWGLGDLVIAAPFLRASSERYDVTLLAKPYAKELQPYLWPDVHVEGFVAPWTAFRGKYKLWSWPWGPIRTQLKTLARMDFDIGLSGRWDPRDHVVLKFAGARKRLGFPRVQSQAFLTHPLPRVDRALHRYESWRVLGNEIGVTLPEMKDIIPISKSTGTDVLVHTGAAQPVRVWPLERYAEIVRRLKSLGYGVRVVCDLSQLDWWRSNGELQAEAPASIARLLELIQSSAVFLGNDSGPAHLSAISGVPTFTLFGPQLPEWFAPMHALGEHMEGKPCPCKPCSDYCQFPVSFCLTKREIDEVWPRVLAFLQRRLPSVKAP